MTVVDQRQENPDRAKDQLDCRIAHGLRQSLHFDTLRREALVARMFCNMLLLLLLFNFFATPQIKMKTIQEKIGRTDLTMARRPKGNYEAYIN